MPKIFKTLEPGDDGHTIDRCERALAAAQALAALQRSLNSNSSEESVLERYWTRQLTLARTRREWRWGDDEYG